MRQRRGIAFWVAVGGTLAATAMILSGKATVLYTFYPPLKAHPAFYIGLTLLVVGSWGWSLVMLYSVRAVAACQPGSPDSARRVRVCGDHHRVAPGNRRCGRRDAVPADPWSLGWCRRSIRYWRACCSGGLATRCVYFWLLPAYVIWYTVLPRVAGGKLFSEPLGRLVFALFILLSTPVGFHHQFMDPGFPPCGSSFTPSTRC